jgi:hypothetical protein
MTLNGVDANENIITIKIASQLFHKARSLHVGSIIELLQYRIVFFQPNNTSPLHVALLLCNFNQRESINLAPHLFSRKPAAAIADLDISTIDPKKHDESLTPEHCNNRSPESIPCCTAENRICSKYMLEFAVCICEAHPVAELVLHEIAKDCCFVSESVCGMTNREKRFLIYWWYATNVYMVTGKHNRVELPRCLVNEIRRLYPNPLDEPYVGYKNASP